MFKRSRGIHESEAVTRRKPNSFDDKKTKMADTKTAEMDEKKKFLTSGENVEFHPEKLPLKPTASPFLPINKEKPPVSTKKKRDTSRCKFVVMLLTLVAIVELVAMLVVTVRWRDTRVAAMKRREQRLCLPKNHFDTEVCTGELETQGDMCCGDVSRLVDVLIKQYSDKKFRDSSSARMLQQSCEQPEGQNPTIVVMMSGLAVPRIQQQGEGTLVFWDENSPRTILNGFRYRDGSIFVNQTGHYYVYSQIKVQQSPNAQPGLTHHMSMNKQPPFFSHYLYRYKAWEKGLTREVLLEGSNSVCNVASSSNELSSSFGAVFKLEKGDRVYVETSHPQNLVNSPESNFFGLYSV